jgi:hypothetical protein
MLFPPDEVFILCEGGAVHNIVELLIHSLCVELATQGDCIIPAHGGGGGDPA